MRFSCLSQPPFLAHSCALKHSGGVKKSERKTWKAASLRLEQSDKRLSKLQDAANKGHEASETSFRQLGGKSEDINQIAARVIGETTNEGKNPAAVMLGRLGGAKGGKARAASLSARRRKEIARKAAIKRWKNRKLAIP
jgi:hypothetical protein